MSLGAPLSLADGLSAIGADAWHQAGYTGQGVKVGILDLGFAGYQELLGTALPAEIVGRAFGASAELGESGQPHGTACAEIVHAVAPGAELYLAAYDASEESMRRAVYWLVAQGVDVITHSATFAVGAMDGSSFQSDLVAYAAKNGVLWVNSMGNYALSHHRGAFTDQNSDGWHEFSEGRATLAVWPSGSQLYVSLNWADQGSATPDLNLQLMGADGRVLAMSASRQGGPSGAPAYEAISYAGAVPGATYYLSLQAASTNPETTFDIFAFDALVESPTPEYSLGTPADSPYALSVGALDGISGKLAGFSSRGPSGDGRVKPDLVAPGGIIVAALSQQPFYGTSASAPQVAGAAALLLGADPSLRPEDVLEALLGQATDLGAPGPDAAYGYGRLRLPRP